jgi:spore germination cell wall hydrolase CwlJ-like protein
MQFQINSQTKEVIKNTLKYLAAVAIGTAALVVTIVPNDSLKYASCGVFNSCTSSVPTVEQVLPDYEDYQCLRQALFFEIRNGTDEAIQNVADVIINRTEAKGFPSSVCKVVQQPYQFSYLNKGQPVLKWDEYLSYADEMALKRIDKIAFSTLVHGSNNQQILWYHTHQVKPSWSKKLKQDVQDKYHRFFTKKD